MIKKDDPAFKSQYGTESAIPVGKLDRLIDLYPSIKNGTTLLSELDKKDRTWILLASLKYDAPITLVQIDLDEEPSIEEPAAEESLPSMRSLVIDTSQAMEEIEHCFLDNTALLNEVTACLQGVDVNLIVVSSVREKVVAAKKHLSRRFQRYIMLLPKHVRHSFVWAACRDNIHSFAQILAIQRQLPDNLEASSITESILKR